MTSTDHTLDVILIKINQFGLYQCLLMALYSITGLSYAAVHMSFVFASMDLEYRCLIPECESPDQIYQTEWLKYAIPMENENLLKCVQYKYINNTINSNSCSENNFDQNFRLSCSEFVYKTETTSIVRDFDIHCSEKQWQRTLIGTLNAAGLLVGLPLFGVFSDRYGRKMNLITGMMLTSIVGIIKSFATSYIYYATCEFIDSALRAGVYSCAFILGIELVGPKGRVLAGTIICCSYALGEVYLAALASQLQSWRVLLRIVYGLNLLTLFYYWLTPESVRWLLANQRHEEAKRILRTAAKVNGKTLREESLNRLCAPCEGGIIGPKPKYHIAELFKSNPLLLRFINICFIWITCAFLFYGLTLNSVALSSNSYLNYILTSLVEIPAYILVSFIVNRIGRRHCLCGSFLLTSVSCIVFIFISKDQYSLRLTFYLMGKFGSTMAFQVTYIISSEIFPTYLRNSLLAFGSSFGRIGAMISPQMPLLALVWKPLPLILYAIMAFAAGLLALAFPETVNVKLPDTIEEAEMIGKESQEKVYYLV